MRARASESWGVIGGGLLGMTLALRLAQAGRRVTLIEAADRLGGLASAWRLGDVVWDRHYHVVLLSDRRLRLLLAELGLDAAIEWHDARTGVYSGGRLHSVSNALELLRFPALGPIAKLRLVATVLYASRLRDGRRLEAIPVARWLTRWSGRQAFESFWLPLLRSKLGESYRDVSAAFLWATIARLYAARRNGLGRERFGTVAGGYAQVVESFARVLAAHGVAVELGRSVVELGRAPEGEEGVAARFAGGGRERFDRVVMTLAPPLAARLCPELAEPERRAMEEVRYLGVVCASLLLTRPLSGFYVTNLLDAGLPFTGVIEMSALVGADRFGGRSLVYLPRYVAPGDPFLALSDAEVEERFLAALRRLYPDLRPDDVVCCRVSRTPWVMALPTLGYSSRLPPMATSVPGLHLVSSAHIVNGTSNVNETVDLAERAAARLTARSEE